MSTIGFAQGAGGGIAGAGGSANVDIQMTESQIFFEAGKQGDGLLEHNSMGNCNDLAKQKQGLGVNQMPKSLLEEEFSLQAGQNKIYTGTVIYSGCSN